MSAQLDAFDVESSEALEAKVGELNVLLERLGQINGKLQKIKDLAKKAAADLLDLRDKGATGYFWAREDCGSGER